jgi:hypothetical protein
MNVFYLHYHAISGVLLPFTTHPNTLLPFLFLLFPLLVWFTFGYTLILVEACPLLLCISRRGNIKLLVYGGYCVTQRWYPYFTVSFRSHIFTNRAA